METIEKDIEKGHVDLADYMGKCEWCYGPRKGTTHGITIAGRCFNVCDICGKMLHEKIETKKQMDLREAEAMLALWHIGHPGQNDEKIRRFLGLPVVKPEKPAWRRLLFWWEE